VAFVGRCPWYDLFVISGIEVVIIVPGRFMYICDVFVLERLLGGIGAIIVDGSCDEKVYVR
jgi:hypothetical protein